MLRKGIVALMISVMSVSGLQAADGTSSNSLLGLFRGPSIGRPQQRVASPRPAGGVKHAVVADVDRQVPEIRQTSAQPPKASLQPAESAPQPTPIQYAPALPNGSSERTSQSVSGYGSEGAGLPAQTGSNRQHNAAPQAVSYETDGPFQFAAGGSSNYGSAVGPVSLTGGGHHLINGGYIPGSQGFPNGQGATLYPAPRPGIPNYVGGTAIVHQAFHPHEMLYAHRYKAMYGPYYYKVNGGWMVTPFGVWSKENWKLQGTTVDVKYKSHISPFAMFHRPSYH